MVQDEASNTMENVVNDCTFKLLDRKANTGNEHDFHPNAGTSCFYFFLPTKFRNLKKEKDLISPFKNCCDPKYSY